MQSPVLQILPGKDGAGVHEDSIDTLHMISHSLPPWAVPTLLVVTGTLYPTTAPLVFSEWQG